MITKTLSFKRTRRGLSMVEVMIASIIASIMSIALVGSLIVNLSSYRANRSYNRNLDQANTAMQRVVYGFNANDGLRQAENANVDIDNTTSPPDWYINTTPTHFLKYDSSNQRIEDQDGLVYAKDVITSTATEHPSRKGIVLTMKIQDSTMMQPIVQELQSVIKFRN
ncbi:MAG: Tfp pilus assembly protein PilV [Kiritimatiellia bacterium]|jgi:Tfp pilus assembly protein PilV